MAVLQSGTHTGVIQLFGLDHGPAAAGIRFPVVVICSNGKNAAAGTQQIVVHSGIIVHKAAVPCAVVHDLHGRHAFVLDVVFVMLCRPGGVVIGDKKALFPSLLHHIADTLRGINPDIIRLFFIKLRLLPVFRCIAEQIGFPVPAGLLQVIRFQRDQAHMAGFCQAEIPVPNRIDFHFIAMQRQEILICQIIVGDHNVVIGVGDYRIPMGHIVLFDLFRGQMPIGDGAVTMQICFVKLAIFRQ